MGERLLHRVEVVELRHPGGLGRVDHRAHVAGSRERVGAVLVERHEGLVHRAVVAPVEDQHPRPARDLAERPQHPAVGVGGGERELPVGAAPKRRASSRAHPGRVLGGKHHGDAGLLARTAPMVGSGEWPAIAPVSPRQKSAYSWPSTSTTRAPSRLGEVDREAAPPHRHPGHRHAGQEAGRACSCSSRERGCSSAKRSRSRSMRRGQARRGSNAHYDDRRLGGVQQLVRHRPEQRAPDRAARRSCPPR